MACSLTSSKSLLAIVFLHRPDFGECAVVARVVEPVAHDKLVFYLETREVGGYVRGTAGGLVEQHAGLDFLRAHAGKGLLDSEHRIAGIENVVYHEHLLAADIHGDVNLFAFTFAENISMRALENTDFSLAQKFTKDAGLGEKLESLPNGLNTQLLKIIYDDGIDMSGGEKQKLALARALYKNSPVVILDEPTSALDAIAESKLYEEFDKLIGGKTAVYISHRLSSTQFCNNVAMFMEGKMIEYGTHDSLMAANGEYAKMFNIQSQYYLEEDSDSEQILEASHDMGGDF